MPGGRPTTYKPEYCEQIIECMAQGNSITRFAAALRVAKSTVYKWMEEHQEFSDAVQVGRTVCEDWYEQLGKEHLLGERKDLPFNQYQYLTRVICKWKDTQHIEQEVKSSELIIDLGATQEEEND